MNYANLRFYPKPAISFTSNELNKYFAGISVSHSVLQTDLDDILMKASDDGFNFQEVVLAVTHFSSKAKGNDGIPQSVFARSLPVIGHHLATLFNASLTCEVFLEVWKRPIWCLLRRRQFNLPLRIFVHRQISEHVESKNILGPPQIGFRQHHSRQTVLLRLAEDIRASVDSKNSILSSFYCLILIRRLTPSLPLNTSVN